MPEAIGEVSVFGLHRLLEKLKQQLESGAISLEEYEETQARLKEEAALRGAKPPRKHPRNQHVPKGHGQNCTCLTCARMNY